VVAAAGNDDTDLVQYPAGYEGVISVTAIDGGYLKAPFANYGRGWVDIAAPGVGIMSTMINDEGAGYASWSGTSMSTAFVSGAAALVIGKTLEPSIATSDIDSHLWNSGKEIDTFNPTYAGQLGRLLNVNGALQVPEMQYFMPFAQR
jgi:serine protease